jgi:lipopolysaccharide transport system ATP-binding protein
LGIIGRNGAGKSTLLKILSRITPPTTGRIVIKGKVSSLLEVGTGFHPELTGRENVFLNGAILGMRKKEIKKKFDQIVDFSGVEKFLDTPVKRYSSGMRVRLAFSVAAHLEPDILIIDEVLAVGDGPFQKKCKGKMEEVGKQGRTVIYVSHIMPSVMQTCTRVILLNEGRIAADGSPHDVVGQYLKGDSISMAECQWPDSATAPQGKVARLCSLRICTEDGRVADRYDIRHPVCISIEYEVLEPGHVLMPTFSLIGEEGNLACVAIDQDKSWRGRPRPIGRYVSTGIIPGNFLGEGLMTVNTAMWTVKPQREMQYVAKEGVAFRVFDSMEGDSAKGDYKGGIDGSIRPAFKWVTHNHVGDRQSAVEFR